MKGSRRGEGERGEGTEERVSKWREDTDTQ